MFPCTEKSGPVMWPNQSVHWRPLHAALRPLAQRTESGHGVAAHGDRELLARLRAPEDLGDAVAQLALRYLMLRHSCYGL